MRIALVHNERAGAGLHSASDLVLIFRALGHEAEWYRRDTAGLLRAVNDRPDVIVASGGDGTVAQVAIAMCGADIPLFILPIGTSNNVALSLGAAAGSIHSLAGRLASARQTRLDIWRAAGEGFETEFVESAGAGVIGSMFDEHANRVRRTWRRIRGWWTRHVDHWDSTARHAANMLRRERPRWFEIHADGQDLSGEYVTVEAMNVRTIGPRVALAPHADPGDGWLDLVLVTPAEQHELAAHIEARGSASAMPSSPARRVNHIELDWPERGTHVDDTRWPPRTRTPRPDRVRISLHGGVNVLVPD